MNFACGKDSNLESWDSTSHRHELDHVKSMDKCLTTGVPARQLLKYMEQVTGSWNDVWTELDRLLREFWVAHLNPATESNTSTPTSPWIWEHRYFGRWEEVKLTPVPHNGTNGC